MLGAEAAAFAVAAGFEPKSGRHLLLPGKKGLGGVLFGLEIADRASATMAAHSVGVSLGCRILRAHDVRAARRVCDTLAAVMEAA